MSAHNRNSCFYCGVDVDPRDYDYIGSTQVWICADSNCHRELSYAINEEYEFEREEALREVEMRYGGRW